MPDFRGLETWLNNILGLFPGVSYFRFNEYNGEKSEAGIFKKNQASLMLIGQVPNCELYLKVFLNRPDIQPLTRIFYCVHKFWASQ